MAKSLENKLRKDISDMESNIICLAQNSSQNLINTHDDEEYNYDPLF